MSFMNDTASYLSLSGLCPALIRCAAQLGTSGTAHVIRHAVDFASNAGWGIEAVRLSYPLSTRGMRPASIRAKLWGGRARLEVT